MCSIPSSEQDGVGGDYRTSVQGAHVRQLGYRKMCVGPAAWSQNVCIICLSVDLSVCLSVFMNILCVVFFLSPYGLNIHTYSFCICSSLVSHYRRCMKLQEITEPYIIYVFFPHVYIPMIWFHFTVIHIKTSLWLDRVRVRVR